MDKVYVDKARLLKRVIIISWASLALCFVIKIFGGNFFEIMCESENYKALCEYADTHLWLKFIIGFLSSMLCQSLYVLAILQKYKFSKFEFITTFASVFLSCLVKLYSQTFGIVLDIWTFILMPMVFLKTNWRKYIDVIVAELFVWAFQILSLLTKNLGIVNVGETYFIGLIYMIDLYIMCLLYYLYRNNKKEKNIMGILWGWFAGKPVERLLKMKAKRETKIHKLETEKHAIELEIAKRKNEK